MNLQLMQCGTARNSHPEIYSSISGATEMYPGFELASQIMDRLYGAGHSPRRGTGIHTYSDVRDLLGFVDGTGNAARPPASAAGLIGEEDHTSPVDAMITQKYLHDLRAWNALPVGAQQKVIGRTKLSDTFARRDRHAVLRALHRLPRRPSDPPGPGTAARRPQTETPEHRRSRHSWRFTGHRRMKQQATYPWR